MRVLYGLWFICLLCLLSACSIVGIAAIQEENTVHHYAENHVERAHKEKSHKSSPPAPVPDPVMETIKLSVAGDFTIGSDESFGYYNSFNQEADKNGLAFFVENIKDLFSEDDFTSVNLETTLTTSTKKADKKFRFKGDPSYAEILTLGSIEAVNLANNHTYDYLQKGYEDTIHHLNKYEVGYFGNKDYYMTTIKDIKIGALGYNGWHDTKALRTQISRDIQHLRDEGVKLVLVHFHWGEERMYVPNETQKALGRYTVDSGADLVVGHHPHVVQGIEEYNGKFIVYSLGNFMFGGNRNPSDKDTFVFQQTFHFIDGEITEQKDIQVIPYRISSVTERNNFQPTPLNGLEAKRVLDKIIGLSAQISDSRWVVYDSVLSK
ncbi:CapA family protein [Bacillus salitolerans]|uniref:CapA family protein n=1 Tax=Bacillus salitolerans TaxID=1437434 RepID=A0ABW4LZD6_9BACI